MKIYTKHKLSCLKVIGPDSAKSVKCRLKCFVKWVPRLIQCFLWKGKFPMFPMCSMFLCPIKFPIDCSCVKRLSW